MIVEVVKQMDGMLIRGYHDGLPEPLGLVITATDRRASIDEAVKMFIDKGWYAIAVDVEDKVIVRIWDKEFDYEAWLCQGNGTWRDGDEERFMVTVKPNIFDPTIEKIISVCAECKDSIDESKTESALLKMAVPGPGMEA